jgi:stearoyl-CoA desaturase (delta-9 desaturase)
VTRFHRNLNIGAVVLPFAALLAAIPMLWNDLTGWTDLTLFAVMYAVSTAGITSASTAC